MGVIDYGNKTMNSWSAQESVAPYIKAVVSDGSSSVDACRAIYVKSGTSHTLTIDGKDVAFTGMNVGEIYPISCTKSNTANIIFLY